MILSKFGMMGGTSIDTPMVTNLEKHSDFDSDLLDPTMYKQWIGSLMIASLRTPEARSGLDQGKCIGLHKACVDIPAWYRWVWTQ